MFLACVTNLKPWHFNRKQGLQVKWNSTHLQIKGGLHIYIMMAVFCSTREALILLRSEHLIHLIIYFGKSKTWYDCRLQMKNGKLVRMFNSLTFVILFTAWTFIFVFISPLCLTSHKKIDIFVFFFSLPMLPSWRIIFCLKPKITRNMNERHNNREKKS